VVGRRNEVALQARFNTIEVVEKSKGTARLVPEYPIMRGGEISAGFVDCRSSLPKFAGIQGDKME